MTLCQRAASFTSKPSESARRRILSARGEPLFITAWERVLMIHFEVDAERLQRDVPFELDLRNGRGFVSLVAFRMRGMRPRIGGKLSEWLFRPIATHDFLNVRTYVRHGGECGIHFLAEWLSNRLAVALGPATFSLPYHHGGFLHDYDLENGVVQSRITDTRNDAALSYRGRLAVPEIFQPCEAGSLNEWLMERYTAFNAARGRKKFFRVWHPPWPQCAVDMTVEEGSLLVKNWPWFESAQLVGANYSPGFEQVWMGRPHAAE